MEPGQRGGGGALARAAVTGNRHDGLAAANDRRMEAEGARVEQQRAGDESVEQRTEQRGVGPVVDIDEHLVGAADQDADAELLDQHLVLGGGEPLGEPATIGQFRGNRLEADPRGDEGSRQHRVEVHCCGG